MEMIGNNITIRIVRQSRESLLPIPGLIPNPDNLQ